MHGLKINKYNFLTADVAITLCLKKIKMLESTILLHFYERGHLDSSGKKHNRDFKIPQGLNE